MIETAIESKIVHQKKGTIMIDVVSGEFITDRCLRGNRFEGGMTIANAHKDSALILEVARKLGVPLFATAAAHTPYEIALSQEKRGGHPILDYASISKLWEKWAGVSFGGK